jgi:Protein of unknown function (DUF3761)
MRISVCGVFCAVSLAFHVSPVHAQAQYVPSYCAPGYYRNAEGVCVHKPTAVPYRGATALCADGLYSYATRGPDICANHGGIVKLLR